jgi:adiponectin receptor
MKTPRAAGARQVKASYASSTMGVVANNERAVVAEPRVKAGHLPLYRFDEIPTWQRDNDFIHGSYRAFYTTPMIFRSIFAIHNETGNIWTHLIGLIIMVWLSIYVIRELLVPNWVHYGVFLVTSAGACVCLGCSTLFHAFEGHCDHTIYKRFASFDYFGITTLIVGSFIPPIYYCFYCFPQLQIVYLTMIFLLGSVGLVGPLFDFFSDPKFYVKRVAIFVVMVASGVFPTLHVFFILPRNHTTIPFSVGVALMFLLYGTGVIIYVTRFPERCFPGRFDLFCSSHQIWHMFVLAATVVHFYTCMGLYQQYKVSEGAC